MNKNSAFSIKKPHIHKLIDWVTEAYIVHQDKVLLRFHEKYDIWLGVGGHVELDEDPNQTTLREVKEEVGLDIELIATTDYKTERVTQGYKDLIPPAFMNMHKINDTHYHLCLIYFAKSNSNKVIPENKDDKWKWLTADEIKSFDNMLEDVRKYSLRALEEVNK
jgi:8-oxo-dGTP pyrophosphatase MutT (NUDIX family)